MSAPPCERRQRRRSSVRESRTRSLLSLRQHDAARLIHGCPETVSGGRFPERPPMPWECGERNHACRDSVDRVGGAARLILRPPSRVGSGARALRRALMLSSARPPVEGFGRGCHDDTLAVSEVATLGAKRVCPPSPAAAARRVGGVDGGPVRAGVQRRQGMREIIQ